MFDWSEKAPEPSVLNLKKLCHTYGIQNEQDAVYMDEYKLDDDRRVDVLTIDLQKLTIKGFEVKVSRSDFLGDDKWHTYLRYFNFFAFVTVPGLIKPSELPPEVYLLEWSMREHEVYSSRRKEYRPELKLVKRGKRLQPKFVRETYGEHFFHSVLLGYVRNLRWRSDRLNKTCSSCSEPLLENPEAASSRG